MKFTIVFLVFISSRCYSEPDWCKLSCNSVEKNTMCKYKPQTAIKDCEDIKDNQTPAGRETILRLHNAYRNEMAGGKKSGWPKAADMMQMTWDQVLEEVALRWAQQCVEGHDVCRRTQEFVYVGQNYGMEGNSADYPSSNGSFDGWVEEISLIKNPESMRTNFRGGKWGHFTQVVWARSLKLGCAEIHTKQGLYLKTIIICNYGPSGNIVGGTMYKKGEPCTKCPQGTECQPGPFPYLCAFPPSDTKPIIERANQSIVNRSTEGSSPNISGTASCGFKLPVIILNKVIISFFINANS